MFEFELPKHYSSAINLLFLWLEISLLICFFKCAQSYGCMNLFVKWLYINYISLPCSSYDSTVILAKSLNGFTPWSPSWCVWNSSPESLVCSAFIIYFKKWINDDLLHAMGRNSWVKPAIARAKKKNVSSTPFLLRNSYETVLVSVD